MARLIFQVPAVLLLRDNGMVTAFISYNHIDEQRKDPRSWELGTAGRRADNKWRIVARER